MDPSASRFAAHAREVGDARLTLEGYDGPVCSTIASAGECLGGGVEAVGQENRACEHALEGDEPLVQDPARACGERAARINKRNDVSVGTLASSDVTDVTEWRCLAVCWMDGFQTDICRLPSVGCELQFALDGCGVSILAVPDAVLEVVTVGRVEILP